ncbi:MAG: hypothetical protein LW842_05320 [Sphingobacteriales bacterium]|nr:hypothetical protein [Sphingobacteriales bacterium]
MIATILEIHYNISFPYNGLALEDCIINCNGWQGLFKQVALKEIYRIESSGKNLIIFDADNTSNLGGYTKRKKEIEVGFAELIKATKKNINYSIYLLPNDSDNGDLESFYMSCIKPDKRFFIECWNNLYGCLQSKNEARYELKIPKSAGMVYSYVDLFENYRTGFYQNKKTKRDYSDDGLWEYNFEENNHLKSLCKFLEDNLNLKSN